MSNVQNTTTNNAGAAAQGAFDALGGRLDSRTHYVHVVLVEFALKGATCSMKQISERALALMPRDHIAREKFTRTLGAHIATMKTREYIESTGRSAWRLTEKALKLWGAKWGAESDKKTRAPRKRK